MRIWKNEKINSDNFFKKIFFSPRKIIPKKKEFCCSKSFQNLSFYFHNFVCTGKEKENLKKIVSGPIETDKILLRLSRLSSIKILEVLLYSRLKKSYTWKSQKSISLSLSIWRTINFFLFFKKFRKNFSSKNSRFELNIFHWTINSDKNQTPKKKTKDLKIPTVKLNLF